MRGESASPRLALSCPLGLLLILNTNNQISIFTNYLNFIVMKKIFTLVAAALVAVGLNAQEVGQVSADVTGSWTSTPGDDGKDVWGTVSAGTVLAQTTNVTMKVGADDGYKPISATANGITTVLVGTASMGLDVACQGSSNPKNVDGGLCDATATVPASGAFLSFEVAKDGYLYVFHKASSNKTYLVGEEGTLIGYDFAMHCPDQPWGTILSYTMKGHGEFNQITIADSLQIKWPEKIVLGADAADVKKGGVAVIRFAVFKDCKYTVNACGSKITCAGFIFSDEILETKVSDGTTETTLLGTNPVGLNQNVVASVVAQRYYLLSGEEVAAPQAGNTGLYIVKNIMSDGSVNINKVLIK